VEHCTISRTTFVHDRTIPLFLSLENKTVLMNVEKENMLFVCCCIVLWYCVFCMLLYCVMVCKLLYCVMVLCVLCVVVLCYGMYVVVLCYGM